MFLKCEYGMASDNIAVNPFGKRCEIEVLPKPEDAAGTVRVVIKGR